jgi:hypothetical protein
VSKGIENVNFDAKFAITDDDLVKLAYGKLNPHSAII